jgi:hypothetical protein
MKIFSTDITVIMTAYILAESEDEAKQIAAGMADSGLEFSSSTEWCGDDTCMTGASYESMLEDPDDFATINLSPACTIESVSDGLELVEEDD